MLHNYWFVLFLLAFSAPMMAQSAFTDIVSVNPEDVVGSRVSLETQFHSVPPTKLYSPLAISMQRIINKKNTEAIICQPEPDVAQWTEIDFDPITPYTWKWVDLESDQKNGTLSKISLRRPLWWLAKSNIDSVGSKVLIEIPEMDLYLNATVVDIRLNQLDTRFWSVLDSATSYSMPITGKFRHLSSDVYALYYDQQDEPLKVTGNHLIWSVEQNGWVSARELFSGERIKTLDGYVSVRELKKLPGTFEVFNLEVYRAHNYHVTRNSILVHNECWNPHWDRILKGLGDRLYNVAIQDAEHIQRVRIIYQPSKNWRGNYGKDWREIFDRYGKKDYPTSIQINVDVTGLSQEQIEHLGDMARNNGFVPYTNPSVDLQRVKVKGSERVFMPIRRYGNDALPGHGEGAPIKPVPEPLWKPGQKF